MNLPKINIGPVHQIDLKVLGKKINFSPFNVEQEKGLLTALDSKIVSDIIQNYMKVLDECVDIDLNTIQNLSLVDFFNLTMILRAKSDGEIVSLRKKECEGCKKEFQFEIDIEDCIKYANEENTKDIVKINDSLQLEIVPLKVAFLDCMESMKDELDIYLFTAANSVSKIIYNETIYSKFTSQELVDNVLGKLRKGDLVSIFDKARNLISIKLVIETMCPNCGKKETDEISDFLKFLA